MPRPVDSTGGIPCPRRFRPFSIPFGAVEVSKSQQLLSLELLNFYHLNAWLAAGSDRSLHFLLCLLR